MLHVRMRGRYLNNFGGEHPIVVLTHVLQNLRMTLTIAIVQLDGVHCLFLRKMGSQHLCVALVRAVEVLVTSELPDELNQLDRQSRWLVHLTLHRF
jgi:hypothetical protein